MSDAVQQEASEARTEMLGGSAQAEMKEADNEMMEMLTTLHSKDEDKRVTATLGAKESIKFGLFVKLLEQNRDKESTKVPVTNSTVIRAAVRFLLSHWDEIEGSDEEEILASIRNLSRRRR